MKLSISRFQTKAKIRSTPSADKGELTSGGTVLERGHMKFFPSIEEIKL